MEYKVTASRTFIGQGIPFESKEKLDIFQDIAYGLTRLEKYSIFDHCPPEEKSDKCIGVWHGGSDWKLHYYIGGFTLSQASTIPPQILVNREIFPPISSFLMPGSNYAVFTFEAGKNLEDTCLTSQMAARYIKYQWAVMNNKFIDYMNYIFEEFSDTFCSIYIPLLSGMGGICLEKNMDNGIDDWIRYIDEHIFENLTVEKTAEYFYYSPRHFRDVFTVK